MSRYPETIHISSAMAESIDQPVDAAVISSRPGGGNTTQSFLKGDIIADNLNAVFGPLGWSVAARIHQMDDWDEEKTVTRNNQPTKIGMHMVQVVSDVTLTIKKTTADGSDTVFTQPGIGYGEAEEGKSRKEAFGMAVKGAATDGLKRCASLVGKRFGMMMASNGSQDDIEYAHNGKQQNLRRAQDIRRQQGAAARSGGQADDRGQGRARDDAPRGRQQDERQRDQPRREAAPREERGRGEDRDQGRGSTQERPAARQTEERQQERAPARQAEERQQERAPARQTDERQQERDQAPARAETTAPEQREEAPREPARAKDGDQAAAAKPAAGGKRQADTNYPLDSLPITKQDMTDFGATLVERVKEMRQHSDRVGLVKQHLNTIKNLDSAIRRRVIDRLREVDVDVDKIPS